jgi:hypothetical protein
VPIADGGALRFIHCANLSVSKLAAFDRRSLTAVTTGLEREVEVLNNGKCSSISDLAR